MLSTDFNIGEYLDEKLVLKLYVVSVFQVSARRYFTQYVILHGREDIPKHVHKPADILRLTPRV